MLHGGEIRKLSDSQFVWTKPDLSLRYLSSKPGFTFSPNFEYKENTYCLHMKLSKSSSADSRYLLGYRIDTFHFSFATYSLSIEDRNGDDLGTFYSKDYGKFCYFYTDELSLLSFEDFFQFHLTFDPPTIGQSAAREVVISAEGKLISPTDVGTQTWSDLQPASSSACSTEGTVQLSQNFKDLLLKGHKTDLKLKVEGTEFRAHKLILSARSPVFEKMFDHDMLEESSGCVTITDCEPDDFHTFLLYLYTGKVEKPTVESSARLYCLADKYNVEGLVPYCVQFLLSNLSVESYCTIVLLGLRHCDTELMTPANAFFVKNLKQIVGTDQWKSFNTENPAEANEILIKGLSQVILLTT